MKHPSQFLALILLLSCSVTPPNRGPVVPRRVAPADSLSVYASVSEGERREITAGEFATAEWFRDNPIDPGKAGIGVLGSIPGMSRSLALRIVRARRAAGQGRSWIERLSPSDKAALHALEEYLRLPGEPRRRVKARLLRRGIGSRGRESANYRISLTEGKWKAVCRIRDGSAERELSAYLSFSALDGALGIHAGDFLPDFGMGLLLSGYNASSPLHGGYFLRKRGRFFGRASFYCSTLRGIAATVAERNFGAALFCGRPRRDVSGNMELDTDVVFGARIHGGGGGGSLGLTLYAGDSSPPGTLASLDGRLNRGKLALGGEIALDAAGRPAAVWGMYLDGGKLRLGFLFHGLPQGGGTRFCWIPGKLGGTSLYQRGLAVLLARSVRRRFRLTGSYERSRSGSAFEYRRRDVFRLEAEYKLKPLLARFSWVRRTERRAGKIPWPDTEDAGISESGTAGVLLSGNVGRFVRSRLSIRSVSSNNSGGYMLAPSVTLAGLSSHMKATAAFCIYRSIEGRAVFRFYEPSLPGSFPWITTSGDGGRTVFLVSIGSGGVVFSCRLSTDEFRRGEGSVQASFDF